MPNVNPNAQPLPGTSVMPALESALPRSKGSPTTGVGEPARRVQKGDQAHSRRWTMLNLFVDVGMRELNGTERGVWMALYRDERDGVATTCRASIAERCGVTERAVSKALRSLEGKGMVEVVKHGQRGVSCAIYRLKPVPRQEDLG